MAKSSYFDVNKSTATAAHMNMLRVGPAKECDPTDPPSTPKPVLTDNVETPDTVYKDKVTEIDKRVQDFVEDNKFFPSITEIVFYVSKLRYSDTTLEMRMKETSIFTGFRWTSSIDAIVRMSDENFEVKDADPRVMKLLFQNAEYFGARAWLPIDVDNATHREYNLFNPSGTIYHAIMKPGSYSSGMKDLIDYYALGAKIYLIKERRTRNVLMLGLVYDFMAFVSHRIRDTTNSRIKLRAHRLVFAERLREITQDKSYEHLFMLTRIFLAILGSIRPPPYTHQDMEPQTVRPYDRMIASQYQTESEYESLSAAESDTGISIDEAKRLIHEDETWSDTEADTPSPSARNRRIRSTRGMETTPTNINKYTVRPYNIKTFPNTPVVVQPTPRKRKSTRFEEDTPTPSPPKKIPIRETIEPPPYSPPYGFNLMHPRYKNRINPAVREDRPVIGISQDPSSNSAIVASKKETVKKAVTTTLRPYTKSGSAPWKSFATRDSSTAYAPAPSASASAPSRPSPTDWLAPPPPTTSRSSSSNDPARYRSSSSSASAAQGYDYERPYEDLHTARTTNSASAPSREERLACELGPSREEMYARYGKGPPPPRHSSSSSYTSVEENALRINESMHPRLMLEAAKAALYRTSADRPSAHGRLRGTPFIVDLVSPIVKKKVLPKLRKSTPDKMNLLQVLGPSHRVLSMEAKGSKVIIDSGASTSGTGQRGKLKNIRPSTCTVNAAFGETISPTEMGDLPPYMPPTIIIKEMNDTTLLSVSQACAEDMCGIFTSRDCRFYSLKAIQPHLAQISRTCTMKLRGEVEDGLYIQKSI